MTPTVPPRWDLYFDVIDARAIASTIPLRTAMSEMIEQSLADHWRHCEAIVREMLGRWVSELEPVIVYPQGNSLPVGLTARGHSRIYIHARETAP